MAETVTGKKKKSVAIRVINIIFIVLAVLAVIFLVLMCTPVRSSLKTALQDKTWAQKLVQNMNTWTYYHVVKVFNVPRSIRGHGYTFSSCLYLSILFILGLCALFLMYLPFLVMHHEKNVGKKETWRKVLNWCAFAFILLCTLAGGSLLYSARLSKDMGAAYTWILTIGHAWVGLFKPKGALNVLVIERLTSNYRFWALAWLCFFILLVEVILLIVSGLGKAKEEITEEKPALEEEKTEEAPVAEIPAPTPAVAVAADAERINPTIREIALLNSLNPLYEAKIETLPDLEEIDEDLERVLVPMDEVVLVEAKENKEIVDKADIINESISPFEKSLLVLPGIDEWGADPWKEEDDNAIVAEEVVQPMEDLTAVAAPDQEEEIPVEETPIDETVIEEPKEAPVEEETAAEEAPAEETPIVEEPAEEEKEVEKVVFINDDLKDGLRPQEEENVKEEIQEEDRSDKKEVMMNNDHTPIVTAPVSDEDTWDIGTYTSVEEKKEEEIPAPAEEVKEEPVAEETIAAEEAPIEEAKEETPVVEEKAEEVKEETPIVEEEPKKVVFINKDLKDGLRPQEEDNIREEETEKSDRSDKKEVLMNNDHTPIVTAPVSDEDTWDIGTYTPVVEEKKEAPVKEEKPAEQPAKPAARVNQIGLKQFDPSKRQAFRPGPVGVVNPIKKEEPVKEEPVKEEKKVVAPISGPLHSTEKSKHGKIEKVEARHVAFTLKNYQVKTYEGDLTAEEAFAKGVTKVQPVVNPVFANQGKESDWKKKRRMESIRQNGYGEVTQVEKLNGKPATASASSNNLKKPISIRDLMKNKKAQEQTKEQAPATEEKKISKPITPVNFKPVAKEEPKKAEEIKQNDNPFSDKPSAPFKPIAPIPHKEKKRPEIKPIDPMKSSKK